MEGPRDIRRFETIQLVSIAVGLIHAFATFKGGALDAIIGAVITVALTLLVSRRRQNWARWVLLAMFLFGAAFMVWFAKAILSAGYPAVTLLVTLMQTVALAMLFTRQSSDWLRHKSSPA